MKIVHAAVFTALFSLLSFFTFTSMKKAELHQTRAYLEITLDVKSHNRADAGAVYLKYKNPFLNQIKGATSKELLIRQNDVQVLHGFETEADAQAYLTSPLFEQDVVKSLQPYLEGAPEVRIYEVFHP